MDDFAWENDKIAFRMYGKALEGTAGDAHGIDVWVKRTSELVINKWYKSGDYHKDHGDGMDYYSVGMTLGAGDIVPFTGDTLWFPNHYRGYQVLDNGPLRSTFRLDFEQWNAGGMRSEEHTSELQSLMRISYAVFCLQKDNTYLSNHQCQSTSS